MPNDDEFRRPGRLAKLSLRKLAEYARREELIDSLEVLGEHVVITQSENRFVLPKRQASTFLIGMLRGRSWFAEEEAEEASPAPAEGSDGPSTQEPAATEARRALDSTLDSMLNFTRDVGIIEGFEKHENKRNVRIDITACSSELSYTDALNYLLDCIQYEMRALRGGT